MDYQDKCENGIPVMKARMMLMSATVEETHGDGTGMTNGKKRCKQKGDDKSPNALR